MPAGRPPKPTAVKVLEGTYRPDRAATNEIQPELLANIPDPPEGLREWGVREWYTACRWLHDRNMLAVTDLSLLAMYCNEVDNYWHYDAIIKKKGEVIVYRNAEGEQTKVQTNPYCTLKSQAEASCARWAAQFGFTPATRSRITAPTPRKEDSNLDKLMKKRLGKAS